MLRIMLILKKKKTRIQKKKKTTGMSSHLHLHEYKNLPKVMRTGIVLDLT